MPRQTFLTGSPAQVGFPVLFGVKIMQNKFVKRRVGRPTKYTQEFIEHEADALIEYLKTAEPIPFIKDFAHKRGYTSAEIAHLFVSNQKFLHALNSLRDVQETKLVFGSLTNKLNSYMSMNTLKNVSGWRDKQEHEHTGEVSFVIKNESAETFMSQSERGLLNAN